MTSFLRRPWISRQLPVWGSALCLCCAAGVSVWADTSQLGAGCLAAGGGLAALLPLAAALSAWSAIGFGGLDADGVRAPLAAALGSRDPDVTVKPFLLLVQIPVVFGATWQVSAFAARAFHRADLAALLVGAAAAAAFLAAVALGRALRPAMTRLAERAAKLEGAWYPLSSLWGSILWALAILAGAGVAAAAAIRKDLLAADLGGPAILAGGNAVLLALVAASIAARRWRPARAIAAVLGTAGSAAGLALAVLGLCGACAGPSAVAAAMVTPGIGLGIDLGRAVTDVDGDGFSSLLAGGDCAALDPSIHPGARDVPGNGVDEDCSGTDSGGGRWDEPAPRFADPSPLCPGGDCNVVILGVDSFRADQLTFHGSDQVIMPRVEALARRGAVFLNNYTPGPGTILTVPAMLAGVFDSQIAMTPKKRGPAPVADEVRLIQETLREIGVTTLAVNEHVYNEPLNQGWDVWDSTWDPRFYRKSTAARQVEKVLALLEEHSDRRLFLYTHLEEPHHDYLRHEGFSRWGGDDLGRYRSELAFTDHHLGRVFDFVAEEITARPTLLIVTSDHGEGLGQHGIKYHNHGFYRELTNVPLIVWHPAIEHRMLEAPVALYDIAPTLRNLYGLPPRPDHVGTSLLGQILEGDELEERTVYQQGLYDQGGRYYNLVGITRGSLRLFHDMRRRTWELYDVSADPREERNLADPGSPAFTGMREDLEAWLEAIGLDSTFVHRPWEEAPPGARSRRR